MTASITFFPVGNGDMTLITFDNGQKLLADLHVRKAADDDDDHTPDVMADLRGRLTRDEEGRLFVDGFLLSHPDKDHICGLETHFHLGPPDEWDEDDAQLPGQLAVDVYETKEKLVVKARTAGVNKNELDVSISDNQLTIKGTLSAGSEEGVENYFLQECYWGEFSRTIALPVPVKEEEIEAVLKDGVLTISFGKVKQDTVKKIQVL